MGVNIGMSLNTIVVTTLLIAIGVLGCSTSEQRLTGTATDIDGNAYLTVRIGDQWWFAENLRVTRYADGTPIADGTSDSTGSNLPRRYTTHRDSTHALAQSGDITVYNWAAVMRGSTPNDGRRVVQGPAPEGWHIPSLEEWQALYDFLAADRKTHPGAIAATLLGRESQTGFDALFVDGWFRGRFLEGPADQANFWSSTPVPDRAVPHAYAPNLGARPGEFIVGNGANVLAGWSVRCVKNAKTPPGR